MSCRTVCEEPLRRGSRGWSAVAATSAAVFALVTAEMLPVGILLPIAGELSVTPGLAGLMVSAPGAVAAIAALGVPIAVGRLDRRLLLCGLMTLLVAANLACAIATDFRMLLAARLVVGVSIGGFWAIAGGLAIRLVEPADVPRASALIFGGVAAASVLGVPLGATIGDWLGWRAAFWAVAGLSLALLVALSLLLPRLPAATAVRPSAFLELASRPGPRAGLVAIFLIVIGHFAGYTFVSALLERNGGVDGRMVGALLLAYGVAGVAGNFIVGALVAGDARRAMLGVSAALGAVMLLTPVLGQGPFLATALLISWGIAYGGVPVGVQTLMRKTAPDAPEPASAALAAIFNASIGLGALVGGLIVDRLGIDWAMWFGGAAVLLASAAIARARGPR